MRLFPFSTETLTLVNPSNRYLAAKAFADGDEKDRSPPYPWHDLPMFYK